MSARLALLLAAAPGAALGFDAGGFTLGDAETAVKKAYPSAHCRPLEWKSDAADRRCDDAKITFAGTRSRITVYLKNDAVQAFDVRFDTKDFERVAANLRSRFGKPAREGIESIQRGSRSPEEVYKMRWAKGEERATYTAHPGRKRSHLSVWRGNFQTEIYRVK